MIPGRLMHYWPINLRHAPIYRVSLAPSGRGWPVREVAGLTQFRVSAN
jgi:hypothetical protein